MSQGSQANKCPKWTRESREGTIPLSDWLSSLGSQPSKHQNPSHSPLFPSSSPSSLHISPTYLPTEDSYTPRSKINLLHHRNTFSLTSAIWLFWFSLFSLRLPSSSTPHLLTMLPSMDFINAPGRNHQSSIKIRTQKANNVKSLTAVVLHHPLLPPPPEDWVLFPEHIIHTKHSNARDSRARQAKERLQPAEPSRSSSMRTTPTTSRNTSTSFSTKEPRDQSDSPSKLDRPSNVAKSNVAVESPRNPPSLKAPQRLQTPDLSDVEEDGFWSCCGSSERSV